MVGYVVCFRKKLSRQQDNYVFVRSRSSGRERVMWGLLLPYGLTHFSSRHRSDLILKFSHTICLCTSLLGYAATLGDDGTFANSKTNQFAFVQACYRGDNIPLETRQWMIGAVGFCFARPQNDIPISPAPSEFPMPLGLPESDVLRPKKWTLVILSHDNIYNLSCPNKGRFPCGIIFHVTSCCPQE